MKSATFKVGDRVATTVPCEDDTGTVAPGTLGDVVNVKQSRDFKHYLYEVEFDGGVSGWYGQDEVDAGALELRITTVDSDEIRQAARDLFGDDDLEIDPEAEVRVTADGKFAWVQAWVRMERDDAEG